jgi:hypothetical protein
LFFKIFYLKFNLILFFFLEIVSEVTVKESIGGENSYREFKIKFTIKPEKSFGGKFDLKYLELAGVSNFFHHF